MGERRRKKCWQRGEIKGTGAKKACQKSEYRKDCGRSGGGCGSNPQDCGRIEWAESVKASEAQDRVLNSVLFAFFSKKENFV